MWLRWVTFLDFAALHNHIYPKRCEHRQSFYEGVSSLD